MKLIKTLILFLSISLLCNNAYCSDSTYVKICRDFITDNLRNLDELNRYAIEHSEKELVKIDTQIYFNDCDLIYLRTWLYSSGYSINLFIDTLSGKCYVINYGNSAYEHYSVKALKKVIKKGRLMFSKLDYRAYFNLIF